jgi:formylglycine-generating enzyme required for sulfatase activity
MINKLGFIPIILVLLVSSFSKKRSFIPPGTAQITETFFADETEVSNLAWQEYEFWIKTKYGPNSAEHLDVLPDTLVWTNKSAFNAPYVQYYYRHVAYRNYPVVGISYEQAVAFCKWRTDRVKEYYARKYKKELLLEYRLPTAGEWESLAMASPDIFALQGKNKNGMPLLNFIRMPGDSASTAILMSDNADVTAPVYSYAKNKLGLFNIYGNVAELVAEKGIAKGGSWRNLLEECRAGKNLTYDQPTSWIGLRCVCDLRKETHN